MSDTIAAKRTLSIEAHLRSLPYSELQSVLYQSTHSEVQAGKLLVGSSDAELAQASYKLHAIRILCIRVIEQRCIEHIEKRARMRAALLRCKKRPDDASGINERVQRDSDNQVTASFVQAAPETKETEYDS